MNQSSEYSNRIETIHFVRKIFYTSECIVIHMGIIKFIIAAEIDEITHGSGQMLAPVMKDIEISF